METYLNTVVEVFVTTLHTGTANSTAHAVALATINSTAHCGCQCRVSEVKQCSIDSKIQPALVTLTLDPLFENRFIIYTREEI